MRHKDKPYHVYRGGRQKGSIGSLGSGGHDGRAGYPDANGRDPASPPRSGSVATETRPAGGPAVPPPPPPLPGPSAPTGPPRRRRRLVLRIGVAVLLVAVLLIGWGAFGYFSFRSGVEEANARLPESAANALSPQAGSMLSSPSNILVLGVDTGPTRDGAPGRSDAMMLIRTDPDAHRIAYLSIPRDLRVEIPGQGPDSQDKINAAYAIGGPALAIRAVEDLIGQPVNHVAIVDLASFPQVVDALGGVTIDVEKPIRSNRFECPFGSRAECERWDGWRFAAGSQEMNGRRALVYSRIRQNELDPSESDLSRAARQQQVIQAITDEVVSPLGFLRFPFVGADLVTPLATDLTTGELFRLGWLKFRAADDATLRCRLGGEPATVDEGGGETFYLIGGEENIEVVSMVLGESAPQPAPPDQPFAAGCRVGS